MHSFVHSASENEVGEEFVFCGAFGLFVIVIKNVCIFRFYVVQSGFDDVFETKLSLLKTINLQSYRGI